MDMDKLIGEIKNLFDEFKKEKSRQFYPDLHFRIDRLESDVLFNISLFMASGDPLLTEKVKKAWGR